MYALAILALIIAGAILFLGSRSFAIQSVGIGALLFSVYLVRRSNVHSRSAPTLAVGQATTARPGRFMRIVGVALIPALGLSYVLLYEDSRHGSHQVWPVYLFAALAIACAGVWSALAAKIFQ